MGFSIIVETSSLKPFYTVPKTLSFMELEQRVLKLAGIDKFNPMQRKVLEKWKLADVEPARIQLEWVSAEECEAAEDDLESAG